MPLTARGEEPLVRYVQDLFECSVRSRYAPETVFGLFSLLFGLLDKLLNQNCRQDKSLAVPTPEKVEVIETQAVYRAAIVNEGSRSLKQS